MTGSIRPDRIGAMTRVPAEFPEMSPENSASGPDRRDDAAALVTLAAAQVEAALAEAEPSVCALGAALVSIAEAIEPIANGKGLHPAGRCGREPDQAPSAAQSAIADDIRYAVVALQFHDRLTQKLSHVASNLSAVAELLSDPTRRDAQCAWELLRRQVRARYTMDCERSLADAVLGTDPVSPILTAPSRDVSLAAPVEGGAIDLF